MHHLGTICTLFLQQHVNRTVSSCFSPATVWLNNTWTECFQRTHPETSAALFYHNGLPLKKKSRIIQSSCIYSLTCCQVVSEVEIILQYISQYLSVHMLRTYWCSTSRRYCSTRGYSCALKKGRGGGVEERKKKGKGENTGCFSMINLYDR